MAQLLSELATPINEGKGLNLRQALGHSIAAGYSKGKLHIFDSNYSDGDKDFDITTSEDALAAAKEISFVFNDSFGKKNVSSFPLIINFF